MVRVVKRYAERAILYAQCATLLNTRPLGKTLMIGDWKTGAQQSVDIYAG
jgi:hypothetical protein